MRYDVILKNAGILNESGFFTPEKHILIADGEIKIIADKWDFHWKAKEILDVSKMVITPGFVNLHTHSPMNIFKGLAEDVAIDEWFNKEIWPYESKIQKEHVYAGTMAACCEMIHYGVTAFADHYMFGETVIEAVRKTGVRCDFATTIFGSSPTFREDLESALKLISHYYKNRNTVSFRLGPHAPYTCPPETLKIMVNEASRMKVGLHIHLSETEQQLKDSLSIYGKTPFQIFADAGGFDLPTIIAHGLWVTKDDINLLGDNSYMAISPKTYMKLAMGMGRIWQFSDTLPLTSGTDGAASSNTLNPLEQIRYFGLIGKYITGDAEKFKLKDLWNILMRGHQALPFNSGKIASGSAADLICWDLNGIITQPVYDPLAAIIYSADHSNIRNVMVSGKWLKYEGSLKLDEKKVQKNLEYQAENLMVIGKGKTQLMF
ncbi:amidohydrolase family protein [Tindallia californiensis]|uniref:5-methylthioadenosine/S-adenosylhomocysteine deaminase n=1 Tax=Tindallia californiensis TaxID=159292 RepID=A0A1H3I780_9FIRM|nr:amidohydrolase family protein [Tindallia californiensis]SDY23596.1 5-methylthioadenosine/S-adenosylhomocysteine deaminase [Tindallia californiensis]